MSGCCVICAHYMRMRTDQGSGTVARMNGGHSEVPNPLHEWIPCIVGVERAELRLDGGGFLHLLLVVWLVQQS